MQHLGNISTLNKIGIFEDGSTKIFEDEHEGESRASDNKRHWYLCVMIKKITAQVAHGRMFILKLLVKSYNGE